MLPPIIFKIAQQKFYGFLDYLLCFYVTKRWRFNYLSFCWITNGFVKFLVRRIRPNFMSSKLLFIFLLLSSLSIRTRFAGCQLCSWFWGWWFGRCFVLFYLLTKNLSVTRVYDGIYFHQFYHLYQWLNHHVGYNSTVISTMHRCCIYEQCYQCKICHQPSYNALPSAQFHSSNIYCI